MTPARRLLTHRLRPVDLLVLDVLAALAVAALCAYAALESPLDGRPTEPVWLSLLTGAALGLPLAARRRAPVTVAVVVTVLSATVLLARVVPDYAAVAPGVAIAVACYAVGRLAPGRSPVLIGAVLLMTLTLVLTANGLWNGVGAALFAAVMIGPSWLAGWVLRERRARLVHEAATEERLRVARELHDVVGHTMSLIAVKASVALHVADQRPAEALDALRVIEATSRDALEETRRVLGLLRDDSPGAVGPPHLDGAAELRALADRASVGDVTVHLDVRPGTFDRLPDEVARTAYRIVQEALTNVRKHAAPATCRVAVQTDPEGVRIEVVDDGRRPPPRPYAGQGLIGMRERTGRLGGTFAAGPRPEGGFGVTVLLPHGGAA